MRFLSFVAVRRDSRFVIIDNRIAPLLPREILPLIVLRKLHFLQFEGVRFISETDINVFASGCFVCCYPAAANNEILVVASNNDWLKKFQIVNGTARPLRSPRSFRCRSPTGISSTRTLQNLNLSEVM